MRALVCRGCGADGLEPILSLGKQPLANALTDQPAPPAEVRYLLELVICRACSLVQVTVSVPPTELFGHYAYFSSYSPVLVASAAGLVGRLIRERALGMDDLVLEIGSNDGYLLQHYQAAGIHVLGVDPAENVVAAARARGIPTECAFFGTDTAEWLVRTRSPVAVLHANNVLAHVPDVNGVLGGIARMLAPNGVAIIETPYVRDLVEQLAFDTIYHEHLYYYSVTALDRLLRRNGLRADRIEHLGIHGGSLRVFAVPDEGAPPPSDVRRYLDQERQLGLTSSRYFHDFAGRVDQVCRDLRSLLDRLRGSGARVAGYGAAAKATVLLNAIGADADTLEFVADQSPHKQGRYVPGVGTPIVAPNALLEELPDYVLLLAWNLVDEILLQEIDYRRKGGHFILPIPHPRVIEPEEDPAQVLSKSPAS